MQFEQDADTFIIFVEQNEPIMETLTQFCIDKNIVNAQISGIGAIKNIEMGAYDLENKKYIRHNIAGLNELVSFQGNVLLKDGKPFIHAHLTISDHALNTRGGHLFEARVAAVGEFILRVINTSGRREMNANIGLAVMCLMGEEEN